MTRVFSNENLLIIGAGQYGQVAYEVAKSMNCFRTISFLDDKNSDAVGKISELSKFVSQYSNAIVAIGRAELRLTLTQQLRDVGYQIVTLKSPMAYISLSAIIQEGCVIEPMTVINTAAIIGACSFVSAGAVVNHNAVVGEGCHIDCNATVKSNAVVSSKTKVACGEVVAQ